MGKGEGREGGGKSIDYRLALPPEMLRLLRCSGGCGGRSGSLLILVVGEEVTSWLQIVQRHGLQNLIEQLEWPESTKIKKLDS